MIDVSGLAGERLDMVEPSTRLTPIVLTTCVVCVRKLTRFHAFSLKLYTVSFLSAR